MFSCVRDFFNGRFYDCFGYARHVTGLEKVSGVDAVDPVVIVSPQRSLLSTSLNSAFPQTMFRYCSMTAVSFSKIPRASASGSKKLCVHLIQVTLQSN